MTDTLIASRKHTTIVLLIVAAVTLVGMQQASSLEALSPGASRVIPYLSLIGLQLLWVRFIHVGLKAHGYSLAELTGRGISARDVFVDLFLADRLLHQRTRAGAGLSADDEQHRAIGFAGRGQTVGARAR